MSIIISPAQALLMLMEQPCPPQELDALMRMYIRGTSIEEYNQLLTDKCAAKLGQYSISFLPEVINEDPVRRYFESHLALYTLKNKLPLISFADLQAYFKKLFNMLTDEQQIEFSPLLGADLDAIFIFLDKKNFLEQFAILNSLGINHFHFVSAEKDKIRLVILSTVVIWQLVTNCPRITSHIYDAGDFSPTKRGRVSKRETDDAPSAAYGIMKSYMPLPRNDQLLHPKQKITAYYQRPPDGCHYDSAAVVPRKQFSKLLHPFVSSISGTMLMFLECSRGLLMMGQLPFATVEKFHPLITVLASSLLALGGGHSFYEFMYPVFMPKVQADFRRMPGFEKLTIEQLLYDQNQSAIHSALKIASEYNRTIIVRAHTHSLIRQHGEGRNFACARTAYEFARSSVERQQVIWQHPQLAYRQELQNYYNVIENGKFTPEIVPNMRVVRKKLDELLGKTVAYTPDELILLTTGHLGSIIRRYAPLAMEQKSAMEYYGIV